MMEKNEWDPEEKVEPYFDEGGWIICPDCGTHLNPGVFNPERAQLTKVEVEVESLRKLVKEARTLLAARVFNHPLSEALRKTWDKEALVVMDRLPSARESEAGGVGNKQFDPGKIEQGGGHGREQ